MERILSFLIWPLISLLRTEKNNRELDRYASYNNDPNWFEEWYKPTSASSIGQGCNKWDCMICGQLIKAHLKSKYKSASLEGQEKEREEQ
jgi:putative alpha-1,2-mannosidase